LRSRVLGLTHFGWFILHLLKPFFNENTIFELHPLFQEYNDGIKQGLHVLLNGRWGSFEH
jgi:hypothetical protein